jgi:hypothetical protein
MCVTSEQCRKREREREREREGGRGRKREKERHIHKYIVCAREGELMCRVYPAMMKPIGNAKDDFHLGVQSV